MSKYSKKQEGFVLIVAMILLAVMSLLALSGMGITNMGERMAGNHMDRNRAQMAAEQALTQGMTLLQANAVLCLDTPCDNVTLIGAAAQVAGTTLPSVWSNTNAGAVTIATGQSTSAKYLINYLSDAIFAKANCKPYSIMGRGEGLNVQTIVILQTVAYICPAD